MQSFPNQGKDPLQCLIRLTTHYIVRRRVYPVRWAARRWGPSQLRRAVVLEPDDLNERRR
jgi:hypothetical protein